MNVTRKIYLIFGVIAVTLLGLVGYSFATPPISWTPEQLELTLSQGEEETVTVSFSSNKDLSNVENWLTPELQSYLTVSPTGFETIDKEVVYTLTLNFSIPFETLEAIYEGTIHIRNTEKNSKTHSKPLPITLEITLLTDNWETYVNEEAGIEVKYPPSLVVNEVEGVIVFTEETVDTSLEHPSISISFDVNPDKLSAIEYYDGSPGYDLWGISGNQYELIYIAGINSFKFVPLITLGGEVIVVVPLEETFLRIQDNGAAFQEDRTFNNLLETLILF